MPRLKTHNEFMIDLERKNKSYQNGEFKVIGKYKNKDSKMLFKNKYGYAIAIPNNLLKNYTLSFRSALHPNEYLKEMFREVHGYRYSYDLVNFKTAHINLEIKCQKHGIFLKNSNRHLLGEGCPKCKSKELLYNNRCNPTGWNCVNWIKNSEKSKNFDSFKFYIVNLFNEEENFIKVGRTHSTIKKRMSPIPYKYKLIYYVETTPEKAIEIENKIKEFVSNYKCTPMIIFDGMHECFNTNSLNSIINEFIILTKHYEIFKSEVKVRKSSSKIVLDQNVGIFYDSLKDACTALCLNYKYTSSALSPTGRKVKNKTSLVYI